MWTLEKPDVDDVNQHLTRALTYANGNPIYALTGEERDRIAIVYQIYEEMLGQASPALLASNLSEDCRSAIKSAYAEVQIHGRLKELRSALMVHVECCPLCGFGEVTQLDHYLPKDIYSALAIYPRNLVPSCGPCNNAKRTHVASNDASRLIHAYYAVLPERTFLVADVTMLNGGLDVTYRIDEHGIEEGLAQSLNFQLTRLKLNDRYPKQINKFLSEQRPGVRRILNQSNPPQLLREYLEYSASDLDESFGLNDWRAALLRGLAASEEFCTEGVHAYFTRRRPQDNRRGK